MFKTAAGIQILHVPYKGAGPSMMDTVPGHDDLYFGALVSTLQHVNSKSLHALAVTSLQRVAVAPDIPTMDEQGLKGFETGAWYGVSVASGTPPEIVQKINAVSCGRCAIRTLPSALSRKAPSSSAIRRRSSRCSSMATQKMG